MASCDYEMNHKIQEAFLKSAFWKMGLIDPV